MSRKAQGMTHSRSGQDDRDNLQDYARRVLAGTGISAADIGADLSGEGAATEAVEHGWDMARRAAQVRHDG